MNVKNTLVKEFGIAADRMQTDGKGETQALALTPLPKVKPKTEGWSLLKCRKHYFLLITSIAFPNTSSLPSRMPCMVVLPIILAFGAALKAIAKYSAMLWVSY